MPFTLAHPAITLPLRGILPLSALAVGSMSPDFEYLFRLKAISEFSHTLAGVFYFCVPVGVVFLWLFHSIVRHPLIALLPDFLRRRFSSSDKEFSFFPLPRFLIIISALAVGAFSHIIWDSFTHEGGWAAVRLPFLQTSVFDFGGKDIKLFKLLQHGSTAAGLPVISYCFFRWFRNQPVSGLKEPQLLSDRARYRIIIALISLICIIALSIGFRSAAENSGSRYFEIFVVQTAVGGMVAFALCLLLYGFIYKLVFGQNKG